MNGSACMELYTWRHVALLGHRQVQQASLTAVQASTRLSSHPKALFWAHMTAQNWRRDRMESPCPSTEPLVRSVAGRSSHAPLYRIAALMFINVAHALSTVE